MDKGSSRATRFKGRAALRRVTTVLRCADCGRAATNAGGNVGVRKTAGGVVGFAGLATCGRVWLCPVCNAKVMARRAVELGAMLAWASVEGYQVIFGSVTCRHNINTPLRELLDIQREAWRHVMNSKSWRAHSATKVIPHRHTDACEWQCDRKRDTVLLPVDGRVGYVRAAELTIGRNGWHPHFHPIIVYRGTEEQAQQFADEVVSLWVEGVEKSGGEAIREGGQQLRVVSGVRMFDQLSQYVTKATYDPQKVALEAVWSQSKWGRGRAKETVSHWTLLGSIEAGESDEVGLWGELEAATDGHRMITWSRGLRSFAGIGAEQDDEEIAAQEVGTREDTVAVITSAGWMVLRDLPEVMAEVLDVLESAGVPAMIEILDREGIEWVPLEQLAADNAAGDVNESGWSEREDRTRRYTSTGSPVWVDPELAAEVIMGARPAQRRRGASAGSMADDDFWFAFGYDRPYDPDDPVNATPEAAAR